MNEKPDSYDSSQSRSEIEDDLLDEYDFSQAVRRQPSSERNSSNSTVSIMNGNDQREVVIKTVEVSAIVAPDGLLTVQLPADITPGEHRIVLLIEEPQLSVG